MKQPDIHADDYGLTMNVSKDIMNGIKAGKLSSISIMPNMTCYEDARKYFYDNLQEEILPAMSVHLNFMEGYCVANPLQLNYLVNEEGLFNISWGTLVKYQYNPMVRKKVKKQLRMEIEAQLEKVISGYRLLNHGKKLRIDSHQHTHMIPIVMESVIEVLKEKKYPVEYIRISKEPWWVYLKKRNLIPTYRFVNVIKVLVLNWYSIRVEKLLTELCIPKMYVSGVMLSGRMDIERVRAVLPDLIKCVSKKKMQLEIIIHPGTVKEEEMGKEFNHVYANQFYLSENRKEEYDTMMNLI